MKSHCAHVYFVLSIIFTHKQTGLRSNRRIALSRASTTRFQLYSALEDEEKISLRSIWWSKGSTAWQITGDTLVDGNWHAIWRRQGATSDSMVWWYCSMRGHSSSRQRAVTERTITSTRWYTVQVDAVAPLISRSIYSQIWWYTRFFIWHVFFVFYNWDSLFKAIFLNKKPVRAEYGVKRKEQIQINTC